MTFWWPPWRKWWWGWVPKWWPPLSVLRLLWTSLLLGSGKHPEYKILHLLAKVTDMGRWSVVVSFVIVTQKFKSESVDFPNSCHTDACWLCFSMTHYFCYDLGLFFLSICYFWSLSRGFISAKPWQQNLQNHVITTSAAAWRLCVSVGGGGRYPIRSKLRGCGEKVPCVMPGFPWFA